MVYHKQKQSDLWARNNKPHFENAPLTVIPDPENFTLKKSTKAQFSLIFHGNISAKILQLWN